MNRVYFLRSCAEQFHALPRHVKPVARGLITWTSWIADESTEDAFIQVKHALSEPGLTLHFAVVDGMLVCVEILYQA